LLHEDCTAIESLRNSGAGVIYAFREDALPDSSHLAIALDAFLNGFSYDAEKVNWKAFDSESARESTRVFAAALDRALARARMRQ
jgi:hypothetical protein